MNIRFMSVAAAAVATGCAFGAAAPASAVAQPGTVQPAAVVTYTIELKPAASPARAQTPTSTSASSAT